jgi:uncharacterized membrane protein
MSSDPINAAFVYGLGVAVAIAWVASVFADILIPAYNTPIALHGLMGTVVGSVFADVGLRKARQRMMREFGEERRVAALEQGEP